MTDLPKAYTPHDVEGAIYERWLAADVFAPDGGGSTADPSLPPFTTIAFGGARQATTPGMQAFANARAAAHATDTQAFAAVHPEMAFDMQLAGGAAAANLAPARASATSAMAPEATQDPPVRHPHSAVK